MFFTQLTIGFVGVPKALVAEAEKARNVRSKKVKRGDKEFQDLVDEMMVDLIQQDMDAAGEEAKRKAEKEHEASVNKSDHEPGGGYRYRSD